MNYYCIFCDTIHSDRIADMIERRFRVHAISPKVRKNHLKKGAVQQPEKDLIPGYVFLCTEESMEDLYYKIRSIPGVYRILGREEDGFRLSGPDLSFAVNIFRIDGHIDVQYVFREGEKVALRGDLFLGMHGVVRKFERRNGRALIEFDFDGRTRSVWVAAEIVEHEA